MDGGVVVQQHGGETGFFHMPKLQIPNYQKSRVYIPHNNNLGNAGEGHHPGMMDRTRQTSGTGPNTVQVNPGSGEVMSVQFDGKRMRKAVVRKTVDYNTSIIKYLENRVWQRDWRDSRAIQPDALYHLDMTPPMDMQHKAMNCLTTKFMRQSTNKFRCPIFCLAWTPEGRRLVTGASSGEFTLWNGLTFSFETILQAHETSVRAMVWSHSDQWMVTGDHGGYIKYWQTNMNNVKMYQGHKEAIRSISFCPTDSKFASCSDDGTVRVWDFLRCYEEKILRGHGADVKCVDWHPYKSLIASGSKDNQVPIKLWDPKSGTSLATLHAHKFTVMDVKWNSNGNWLLTAARDHLMKLFDLRNLKEELQVFKGHKKEATSIAWHPINEQMFASGGSDGAIMFWNAGTEKEVGAMEEAHDAIIWDLAWHPLGHVLASASNDHSTKFWSRNRPGDAMRDKYNLNIVAVGPDGEALDIDADVPLGEGKSLLPGMGLEFGLPPPEEEKPKKPVGFGQEEELPAIPGLDWQADAQYFRDQEKKMDDRPRKKTPYARPIPRSFEQAWITNQQPGTLVKDESDGMMKRGKIQSLLSLELPDKPPPGLEYVDFDADDEARKLAKVNEPGSNEFQPPPEFRAPPPSGNFYEEEAGQGFNPSIPGGKQDYHGDQDYRPDKDFPEKQEYHGEMDYQQYNNEGRDEFSFQGHGGPRDQRQEQSPVRGMPGHFRGQFRGGAPINQGYHGNRNESVGMYEKVDREDYGDDYNKQKSASNQNKVGQFGQGFGQQDSGPQGPQNFGGQGPMGQQEEDRYGKFGPGPQGQHNMHGNTDNFDPNNSMEFENSGPSGPSQGGQSYERGRGRGGYGDRGRGGYGDRDRGHMDTGPGGYGDTGRGGYGDRGRGGHGDRGRGGHEDTGQGHGGHEGFRGRGRGWANTGGNPNQSFQQDDNWGNENSKYEGNNDSFNEFQGERGSHHGGGPMRGRGNFRGGERGSRGGGGRGRGNFRGGGQRGRGRGGRGGN